MDFTFSPSKAKYPLLHMAQLSAGPGNSMYLVWFLHADPYAQEPVGPDGSP